ncbi:AI-2E family transporter [Viridibacillus arvi]|uniref:AI-2E family transporter n=1 Tax=Viridibacillus arvi TaxID=263475 RepID=UPI003D06C984
MNRFRGLWSQIWFKKVIAILVFIIVLSVSKPFWNMVLLTFILGYIFYLAEQWLYRKINPKIQITEKILSMTLYLLALIAIVLASVKYVPAIIKQCQILLKQISSFNVEALIGDKYPQITPLLENLNLPNYLSSASEWTFTSVISFSEYGIQFLLALLLSFFFNVERIEIKKFMNRLEKSGISWLIEIYAYYGKNFVNTFGKVLQVQIVISIINSLLSMIMLYIMGFDNLLILGIMIFVLGLIPVAGVIISFIPLSILAFQLGGITHVLLLVVMVLIIHALESYILNPKLMSSKTNLPVFLTFVTLIVSEKIMGLWGLLIGIPLLMFFLEIIKLPSEANLKQEIDSEEIKNE